MAKLKLLPALGLIDQNKLNLNERHLMQVKYEMFPDKKVGLFVKGSFFVVSTLFWNKLKKEWMVTQKEFPLESLSWIIDSFENKFWKKPEEGGLPVGVLHVKAKIADENIRINASRNCCAENLFGYTVRNFSRANYISNIAPQEWDVPRYMLLEQGLLEQLKQINKRYISGEFDSLAKA
ncbi:hypothetical protein [Teredinibacter waterburyi]|uniref:hypothetical protein n=1 Tax=Teredinibacter waterburyi TaxID=1500538 RepID=UPI00165F2AF6|nr:hypothetical protein [Teredinibacter waterburyi]